MVTQNDNSAKGVEVGALLSPEETRKLWKEYLAGTLDKWMYGDLPLGWSQVISIAQDKLTRQETLKKVGHLMTLLQEWGQLDIRGFPLVTALHECLLKGEMPDGGK